MGSKSRYKKHGKKNGKIVKARKKVNIHQLSAELRDARWIAAALLYKLSGGEDVYVEPDIFDDEETVYQVHKIQDEKGRLKLSLKMHARTRIVGDERKGKSNGNVSGSKNPVA